jgi:hypothetical protein
MSAYIHEKAHIDAIVTFAFDGPSGIGGGPGHGWSAPSAVANLAESNSDARNALGRMLWSENVASVAARYPNDTPASRPGPCSDDIDAEAAAYTWEPFRLLTLAEAMMALHSYVYQSCEHDGWKESKANAIIQELVWCASRRVPGYDSADAWSLTESKRGIHRSRRVVVA